MDLKAIKKSFFRQLDRSDCGVVCLLSIIKYFGGTANIENLRETSGTTKQGTTLLGLYQAAEKQGLMAEGMQGNIKSLKTINNPCILHVNISDQFDHYVVCYGFDGSDFIIGDPSIGVKKYSPEKLGDIWKSLYLLLLNPSDHFQNSHKQVDYRRRWLTGILDQDISILCVISVLGLVASVLGLALTVFSQQLIDKILPGAEKQKLITGIALVGLLLFLRGVLTYIRGHLSNTQSRDFNNRLIECFYGSLLYLPKSFFNSRKTGELVARMEDTLRIQTVIAYIFNEIINDILLALISLAALLYYSSIAGIIAMCIIPVYFLLAFLLSDKIEEQQYQVMAANAGKTGNYINTIQGIDTIKVNNKEFQCSLLNKVIYGVFQEKIYKLGKISITLQLATDIISTITLLAIITVCSSLVLDHKLTAGELIAIITLSTNLMPAAGNIAFSNIRMKGAKVAFDRMFEFTAIKPEYGIEIDKTLHADLAFKHLTVNNISFSFPGHRMLINNLSMAIRMGEITALTGESGCGKTTIVNLLLKLYKPDKGDIIINSIQLDSISTYQWRNIVGVVPQEINLFNGTLLDNICLDTTKDACEKAYEFCIRHGFDEYFKAFPHAYNTMLGEDGVNLSAGQKQLIALARALFKKPQVLLLDEPTSSMDRKTEQFVIGLIHKLRNQMGIMIITHRTSLARIAENIHVLHDGIIIAYGNHDDLLLTDNPYSRSFHK